MNAMRWLSTCLLCAVVMLETALAEPPLTTVSLPATADALIMQGVDAADPTGDNQMLEVGTATIKTAQQEVLRHCRVLVRFDLSAIPQDAVIREARLRLRRSFHREAGEGNEDKQIMVSAYRVMKDWSEGRPHGVSWGYSATRQVKWSLPGGDGTPASHPDSPDRAAEPSASINILDLTHGVFNVWDLTADVTAMLGQPQGNFGWILIGPEVDHGDDRARYRSRENAAAEGKDEYRPVLTVVYRPANP